MKVKICGVTSPEDARLAVELGADYLGLNFYPPSPRALRVSQGVAIRDAVGSDVALVGVFVNRPLDEVARIEREVGLDLVQFHGDEPADAIEPWAERGIKVLRITGEKGATRPFEPRSLGAWGDFWAVLFDTPRQGGAGLWGGTGEGWSFDAVAPHLREHRVFVAGGIGPDNVARVVGALEGLWAVDVCSGVESSPGVKDREKLSRLFEEIRHGQGQNHSTT